MSDMNNAGIPEKEKINFYVPDFFGNASLWIILADFIEHIPQWFYDDFKIAAAYGTFPNCIWNGGRVSLSDVDREVVDMVTAELNKRGIALRYTFTNPMLKEEHMSDPWCNEVMEAANNGFNEVLVNSSVVEDYIRKNYPKYKIISSTTKCLRTIEEVEAELEKDYYLVVLDSSLNNDKRIFYLKEKGRLELLVDHCCQVNCPNSKNHYRILGQAQIEYRESNYRCPFPSRTFDQLLERAHSISRDDMRDIYIPAGIKHFKLDGRAFRPETLVDSVLHYMVLPEFRPQMKEIIKKEVYKNKESW